MNTINLCGSNATSNRYSPPLEGLDEVTKGYVQSSTSSMSLELLQTVFFALPDVLREVKKIIGNHWSQHLLREQDIRFSVVSTSTGLTTQMDDFFIFYF
jgi:hypothetical protein